MPGLSGLFDRRGNTKHVTIANLDAMLDAQVRQPWLQVEQWVQEPFAGGRVHLGIHKTGIQPIRDNSDRYILWFDGELYNHSELIRIYEGNNKALSHIEGDAQFVLQLYLNCNGWEFAKDLDGIFNIALFNLDVNEMYLVSDRLGLRPIYYWISPDLFVFSTELKSFLVLPGFPKKLDRLSLSEFIEYGHMLDDRTWFEDVKLLEPGAILRIDQSEHTQRHYWKLGDLKPIFSGKSISEAADEMAHLWKDTVKNRVEDAASCSLPLSGGLDSRAILAAIPEDYLPIPCITIGHVGCDDIRIAKRVAVIRNCAHHPIYLGEEDNWLVKREELVWVLDGFLNIIHMHGSMMTEKLRELSSIMLNGYIGDVIAGGSYGAGLKSAKSHLKRLFPVGELSACEFDSEGYIDRLWQRTSGLSLEAFSIYQRARRFILMGSLQYSSHIEQRKPFVSKDFLTFCMSMPEAYRANGAVYHHMLFTHHSDLFAEIPWQATGVPIGERDFKRRMSQVIRSLEIKIVRKLPGSLRYTPRSMMVDYAELLRQPKTRTYIEQALTDNHQILHEFVPKMQIAKVCERHFSRKIDAQETIGRLLTSQIYLQRLFES